MAIAMSFFKVFFAMHKKIIVGSKGLTLVGMSYENKKNPHLKRHLGTFLYDLMTLAGCQFFTSKKAWKFLIKTQLT